MIFSVLLRLQRSCANFVLCFRGTNFQLNPKNAEADIFILGNQVGTQGSRILGSLIFLVLLSTYLFTESSVLCIQVKKRKFLFVLQNFALCFTKLVSYRLVKSFLKFCLSGLPVSGLLRETTSQVSLNLDIYLNVNGQDLFRFGILPKIRQVPISLLKSFTIKETALQIDGT